MQRDRNTTDHSTGEATSATAADASASGPHRPDRWLRFAQRGLKVVVVGIFIAFCLWAVFRESFQTELVYSLCISISIWLCVDLGRDLVSTFTSMPRFGAGSPRGAWPGWVWMLAIVAVGSVLGYAIGNEIANWLTDSSSPGPFNADFRRTISVLVMALVPALAITYFFQSREVIALQRTEVETARRQATEQQLKLLESQLEPHMLFNTLANLRAMIALDPPGAQAMLDQLIAFLRASLSGSRTRLHPLADEFQRLRDYLALMEIRMGPRLQTHFELPSELRSATVPPLLLQPLVENSIKHGLEPQVAGGRIDVVASQDGGTLVISVRDSGAGFDSGAVGGNRYGLSHVRERLATLYGDDASFTIAPADDGGQGTVATIRMPMRLADPAAAAEPTKAFA